MSSFRILNFNRHKAGAPLRRLLSQQSVEGRTIAGKSHVSSSR
jgi:hypothetical protein